MQNPPFARGALRSLSPLDGVLLRQRPAARARRGQARGVASVDMGARGCAHRTVGEARGRGLSSVPWRLEASPLKGPLCKMLVPRAPRNRTCHTLPFLVMEAGSCNGGRVGRGT